MQKCGFKNESALLHSNVYPFSFMVQLVVCTFFIAGNSCSAKITSLSTDILKIPTLFLSVLILLSHPFSSADFKALSQKKTGIVHCRLMHGGGGFVLVTEKEATHVRWAPAPGPELLSPSIWPPFCTQLSKAAQSTTFSSVAHPAHALSRCEYYWENWKRLFGAEEQDNIHQGGALAAPGTLCTKGNRAQAVGGTKLSGDMRHIWVLCGRAALHWLCLCHCCTAAGCTLLIPHVTRFSILPHPQSMPRPGPARKPFPDTTLSPGPLLHHGCQEPTACLFLAEHHFCQASTGSLSLSLDIKDPFILND